LRRPQLPSFLIVVFGHNGGRPLLDRVCLLGHLIVVVEAKDIDGDVIQRWWPRRRLVRAKFARRRIPTVNDLLRWQPEKCVRRRTLGNSMEELQQENSILDRKSVV
jgi:hypothetical protein